MTGDTAARRLPSPDDPSPAEPGDGLPIGDTPTSVPIDLLEAPPPAAPVPRPPLRDDAVRARINRLIADIDRRLSRQLDAILHHPAFQRMEALWRGAHWLVSGAPDDPLVKVRVLDIRWGEIARDIEKAPTFDQSQLFDRIYSQEFGMPGGEPYGIMVIDHQVWHKVGGRDATDDMLVLSGLAEVAAAAFCPTIVGIDPRMLGLDGFDELDLRQDIAASLVNPEYARWDRLRGRSDSRFLGAVAPRMLARQRHRGRDHPRLGFVYEETIATPRDQLWLSGGFALAHVAARAMARHRWPAAIRGVVPPGEGGLVDGPVRQFLPSDREGYVVRFAVENAVSEEQEVALNAAGLIALRQLHLTGMAAFLNVPSIHRPPDYDGEAARMNAKMSAMLNYIMCVSRFAHYVKVMARDWVGKYTDAKECQRLLQDWLSKYVTGSDDATPETRVRYPLREARVLVHEIPAKPGTYGCEIAIRPHYQLDQIASEFRLTTVIGRELGAR